MATVWRSSASCATGRRGGEETQQEDRGPFHWRLRGSRFIAGRPCRRTSFAPRSNRWRSRAAPRRATRAAAGPGHGAGSRAGPCRARSGDRDRAAARGRDVIRAAELERDEVIDLVGARLRRHVIAGANTARFVDAETAAALPEDPGVQIACSVTARVAPASAPDSGSCAKAGAAVSSSASRIGSR